MIKVLHVVPALDGGGIENLLLNYYSNINRKKIKFDFIVYGENIGLLEKTFEKLGSTIYHIPSRGETLVGSLKTMKKIIALNQYDIVHAHQNKMSFIPLYFAKKYNVNIRIAHSHAANEPENLLNKLERKVFSLFIKIYATYWFACGIDAGEWLYGKNSIRSRKFYLMNNAIDLEKFTFNVEIRNKKRAELGINNKFVVGNIGRLSHQKNHEFLINVFNEVYKKNRNSVLLLAGRGELENDVRRQVSKLGLENAVMFLGIRNDVPELLQAMDVFLMPSRYEGLPVVLIEAQAAGLKSFISDSITRIVKSTDLVTYMSLGESYLYWANELLKLTNEYKRKNTYAKMQCNGYEIKQEAKKIEAFYERVLAKENRESSFV